MKVFSAVCMVLMLASCSVFNFNQINPSPFSVNQAPELVKLGMNINEISENLKTEPLSLDNNNYKFLMRDGELFTRFAGTDSADGRLILWKTFVLTPAGERYPGPDSKAQTLEMMKNNPTCINVEMVASVLDKKTFGKCYYEQFSPDDIYIRAESDTEKVEIIFYNRKFIFTKGDIPEDKVIQYLTSYISNLNLLQSILGEAMGVAEQQSD
jgi:hypothetical protein